jgi:hypothetical protein
MGLRGKLKLWFYQIRHFYRQGRHSSAVLSKILIVAGNPARVVKQLNSEQWMERGVVNGTA